MFRTDASGRTTDTGGEECNVIVAVRVRPLSAEEHRRGDQRVVHCPDQRTLMVSHAGQERKFTFDVALELDSLQGQVFRECGLKRLIDMAIEGYSSTVFAFGQTGSGKTYTTTGPHSLVSGRGRPQELSDIGLMQRSLSYLLDQVQHREGVALSASYLEIYNEQVRDLLNPCRPETLAVRGSKTRGFHVENLSSVEIHSLGAAMEILQGGMQNRQTSSHSQNDHSSRSHSIFTVYIESEMAEAEGCAGRLSRHGKLCVVDLAGSERAKDTGELMEETGSINRSLLTLGKCISALVDPKKRGGHIPYRDSKLTKLLYDSLGGSGVTLMIACVSPTVANLQETMNTLRYASRAKKIKNRPMAKREKVLLRLEREVRHLRSENQLLQHQLHSLEEDRKPAGGTEAAGKSSGEPQVTELAEGVRGAPPGPDGSLCSLLRELMQENGRLQQENIVLLSHHESSTQQRERLTHEISRLRRKLDDLERLMSTSPTASSSHSGHSLDTMSSGSSGRCPHHHRHLPSTFLPALGLSSHMEQLLACPWHLVLHCCGCPSESTLQPRHAPHWHNGSFPFVAQEDPASQNPLPLRRGFLVTDPHRKMIELPPLDAWFQGQASKLSPGSVASLQDPLNLQPSADESQLQGKKRRGENRGHADRFQTMKDARALPQTSPGSVVPTAPPLPTPPGPVPPRQPKGTRRRGKSTGDLGTLDMQHLRHVTRENLHCGNIQ